jgi:hypothetical protein
MALKRFFSLLPFSLFRLFRSSSTARAITSQIIISVDYGHGKGRAAVKVVREKAFSSFRLSSHQSLPSSADPSLALPARELGLICRLADSEKSSTLVNPGDENPSLFLRRHELSFSLVDLRA